MSTKKTPKGSKHHNSTLRESDVVAIRARRKAGERIKDLAAEFGISTAACSKVASGQTWSHITERSGNSVIHADEYHIWKSMLSRCHNPKHPSYSEYGGRGIAVCQEWHIFENFLTGIGKRPTKGHSVDRIDPNKGYSPDNVRWATGKVQARNKRNSVYLIHPQTGEKIAAGDLADEMGIPYREFRRRMIEQGKWPTKQE